MYNHKEIEQKWQKFWEKNKTFKIENDFSKPKYYTLDMFPYPSGAGLHVGHPEGYTANDILARYKTANGFNVLHPMGWDAFGLPAENYAIKTGTHPRITTDENINTFKGQIKKLGFSYDWDREIDTTDPKYYKWTQWIFLKLFEHGLAYEQDLPINYCPSCKTGLANEEVLNDFTCERCGTKVEKRKIRQWVLAITKYADRLLHDVDKLDWPEGIKDMQRNWIGKSEGCEFEMKKSGDDTKSIRVYTTRVDTVFGMTYAVLAPDHKDILDFITPEQSKICQNYIQESVKKSDQDRTQDDKEKTGVFTGSYVINPYNNEKVPLWIADYVLGNYGTGAVMAVPAHDTRDFEFANKYGLEIIQSIAPYIIMDGLSKPKSNIIEKKFKCVTSIIKHPKENLYLMLKFKKSGEYGLVGGSIEEGESYIDAIKREIFEETGYKNFEIQEELIGNIYSRGYKIRKDIEEEAIDKVFVTKLINLEKNSNDESCDEHDGINWFNEKESLNNISFKHHKFFFELYLKENRATTEYGILVDSGEFNGLSSEKAIEKMIDYAVEKGFGHKKVNYKLRDWLYSRQRYWGEPIPLIHLSNIDIEDLPKEKCKDAWVKEENILMIGDKEFSKIYDGLYGKIVCDYNLPLELPEVEEYAPSGDGHSPLVKVDSFVNIKLANNLYGKRETNTMPQWGGSCWYYLRFMDPKNDNELVDKDVVKYWGEVDSYVGGAEHAVLHLLYARFWHKFLFDIGVVPTDEPFYKLRNQGLILAHAFQRKNGGLLANDLVEEKAGKYYEIATGKEVNRIVSKMSKSLKNVINPDDIVKEYGADSLRLYEMYMAEFKDTAPWDTKGIIGVRRFIEKSERLFDDKPKLSIEDDSFTMKLLHKTIKKVGEDIENYKFNTAIAALMILVNNGLPKDKKLETEWKNIFVRLLHPFTPHLAEELWERMGNKQSVFFSTWPKYDKKMVIDDEIEIGVQVLGKLRGTIKIAKDLEKDEVLKIAKSNPDVSKWLTGKQILKEIYIEGRIVNLVVK